jgi:hypothetical protein
MKLFILMGVLVGSPQAWAEGPGDSVGYEISYACVGLDGVPFSHGSAQAGRCCSGGQLIPNPPDDCKAGFGTLIASSGGGVGAHLNQAMQELGQVAAFSGTTAEYNSPASSVPQAETSAMVASDGGGKSGPRSSGLKAGAGGLGDTGSSGSGGSGSGGGGSGGGGGTALGTPGSTKRFGNAAAEAEAVLEAGKYKSAGAGDDGKNKKDSPFDFFGRRDSGSGKGGGNAQDALKFGQEKAATGEGKSEAPKSENDQDYLSRINPGDNLFKVVSRRYVKETVRNNVVAVEKSPPQ